MTTTWTKQSSPSSSSWQIAPPIQNDLFAGLDELFNIMTDEEDNVILFHTWDYEEQNTKWIIL